MKKDALSLGRYTVKEIEEILSATNRWATGQKIGHDPDTDQREDRNALVQNWIDSGAAERFARRHPLKKISGFGLVLRILAGKLTSFIK